MTRYSPGPKPPCSPPPRCTPRRTNVGPVDSVKIELERQKEKRMTLKPDNEQELPRLAKEVTTKLVMLGGLAGREYFDAMVRVDNLEVAPLRTK